MAMVFDEDKYQWVNAAAIADPTDATTTQAAVVSILAALRAASIIATD